MRLLSELRHPEVNDKAERIQRRRAARGIILSGEQILLLYTRRYNDYSFPGGGVDPEEDLVAALERELAEECGATGVREVRPYGMIDELRPHYRPEYEAMHMLSYFYTCEIDSVLAAPKLEHYEQANGMSACWIPITDALAHNRAVLNRKEASMGLSIERETLVLGMVARELLELPEPRYGHSGN